MGMRDATRADRFGAGRPGRWAAMDRPASDALARAIADVGAGAGPQSILAFIDRLLPFTSSLVTVFDRHRPPVVLYDDIVPERHAIVVGPYLSGAYLLDPFYEYVLLGRGSRVIRLKHIQPDHFRKTEFYRNYYANTRLADEVGIAVQRTDGAHIFVSIGLDRGDGSFSKQSYHKAVSFMPIIAALLLRQWDRAPSGGDRKDEDGSRKDRAGLHPTLDDILKRGDFHCLTTREREIVSLMLKGHSSKSIARCLDIAVGTVKNHRKNLYRKLALTSQSVLFARFLQLIDLS